MDDRMMMIRPIKHPRIVRLPAPEPIAAGRLDSFDVVSQSNRADAILQYQAYALDAPGKLIEQNGEIFELTQGQYIPRRIRFLGIERMERYGLYKSLDALSSEHEARTITDLLSWISRNENLYFFLLGGHSTESAELRFYAHDVVQEERVGKPIPAVFKRNWSPSLPMPARLVPQPNYLYRRFGGDPIDININGEACLHRLFIGGIETQIQQRPDVHAVLNLGEKPSTWTMPGQSYNCDRWVNKGEGSMGMDVREIREQAEWCVERLQNGKRILVHCVAGMNRSTTVCCAILILLEGLTAGAALERVRVHHPWARPDSHHWLMLKWLADHPS